MELGELAEKKLGEALDLNVVDYCIALSDVYVELAGGYLGLYHTPLEDFARFPFWPLLGSSARDLFALREEGNMALRALAWAAANAASVPALRRRTDLLFDASPIELLGAKEGDRVLVVGNMGPFAHELLGLGAEVTVLERNPRLRHGALPDTFIEALPMDFAAAVVTGAAIAVPTFPRLLELIKAIPNRAIVGPSASLLPEALHEIGFRLVCGVLVEDVPKVKEWLNQGNFVQGGPGTQTVKELGGAVRTWCSVQ
ncbi:MAG TPA: DUF364 domain-containing protein [Candidatus Bipolaricaulis anaerobius]|jgi:uncharacterized protein (DUF4213/DUF364 family)|nr:hypothetical protein [Candidatus Bipolaricaulis sp.]MDD3748758.1 DUF364 domain-containing protein [Candidatus Bipolaricaulis anaerobius]MDD5763929.1 DUF364 domain-containing protein [Candidatus Bipolaricaulis anaerobius]HNR24078.1 DUF364 domain-containing protein [Candidatus Bipolaricaulis anaerobius]HNS23839.1 DUF364 domain-containing protein [Candidatus Bipolaricaulis anaerobius]